MGLAPAFSPLGENVCKWGKMCLEKGMFGGWSWELGGSDGEKGGWRGLGDYGVAGWWGYGVRGLENGDGG